MHWQTTVLAALGAGIFKQEIFFLFNPVYVTCYSCKYKLMPHTPAVHDPDGDRGAVDLLLGKLNVEELDGGGEVGVLLGVGDDRRLEAIVEK